MIAQTTCRCVCHDNGKDQAQCEHLYRWCCKAWAKGYRDATTDMLESAHYRAGFEAGRSSTTTPPVEKFPAGHCTNCKGPVYRRAGRPGEYDHECSAEATPGTAP